MCQTPKWSHSWERTRKWVPYYIIRILFCFSIEYYYLWWGENHYTAHFFVYLIYVTVLYGTLDEPPLVCLASISTTSCPTIFETWGPHLDRCPSLVLKLNPSILINLVSFYFSNCNLFVLWFCETHLNDDRLLPISFISGFLFSLSTIKRRKRKAK